MKLPERELVIEVERDEQLIARPAFSFDHADNLPNTTKKIKLVSSLNPGQVITPIMGKQIRITLESLDVGQLLDGLRSRAESWRKTAEFFESGYVADHVFICEECSDSDEAIQIAQQYEKIVASIERQVAEQGGW